MERPLVSVLMTSYNREKYIADAIESVLASTWKELELIICDDGSKDKTVEIARAYAEKDTRVKVFINERNLGDYPNRNKAASHAQGKYLKYVDADDLIYPWGLAHLVECMEANPVAGWGLCSLNQDKERIFPFVLKPEQAYLYHYKGPGLFHKAPLSAIIRKDVFNAVGGFSNMRMVGDFEMWHRLGQRYPVLLMPHGMVWYRVHGEQEMNSFKNFEGAYDSIMVKYLTSNASPLSLKDRRDCINSIKRVLQRKMAKAIIKLDKNSYVVFNDLIKELNNI
ncbi:glycosyltransferase [Flavihumibacter rivuli]|uniref:glycosyltransferase family 2 protein n=1 Tax=Flavihumibacter rivuli TaxID=2838156 RepID=UPI001BDF54BE|nr:glycosyltransferase family 2 protein [Flavihumibacter rivuli]ULQ56257.1 glycosyltransferase [Flavihumibacter rivuli]